jgi:hypothetical protein
MRRPGVLPLFPQKADFHGAATRVSPWPGWSAVIFPQRTWFHSEVPDTVLDRAALPTFHFVALLFSRLRVLQQGNIQIYLLYIFLALVALLLWR